MEQKDIQLKLYRAVDRPNGWQSLRHLMLKLKKEDSDKVLDALLGVFLESTRVTTRYADQQAAGGLLWKLKPKYSRNLRDDIRRSLYNWDGSIEELPWCLSEVVGIETVRSEVKSILTEPLDEMSKRVAETYLYWLSAKPEMMTAELDQMWNERLPG